MHTAMYCHETGKCYIIHVQGGACKYMLLQYGNGRSVDKASLPLAYGWERVVQISSFNASG